ncbi:MAG TPA: short chain dehydrogenase [Thermoanaerobaculia bacterium]|jgi:NAD(P)-dependent dehydrogenase (short-subunit alcohol dehydrogenase family)
MRIIVIGATGTIGKAVVKALSGRHEVVQVGHRGGEYQVDMAAKESIERLFQSVEAFDALVSAAGLAKFGALDGLADADFQFSLGSKLMGQVNLVRAGMAVVRDGGSFTLTSGVLASEPMPGSAAISLVNAGVEGFARAAALEMPRGVRINVVSPPWVSETLVAMGRDGDAGMPAAQVARAYVESVEGSENGEVLDARAFAY